MKKSALLLAIVLCLCLCACKPAPTPATQPTEPKLLEVQITAGKITPGMTAKDVLVEVTVDHQPVACRVELTRFTDTGFYVMAEDEKVPEGFYGRLDVYYSLPKGKTVDDIAVTMTCDGGEYDGTGSVGNDAQGNEEAWSHAIYGEEPAATGAKQVNIRVVDFASGMTLDQIKVEVTVDGQTVEHTLGVTIYSEDGFREMPSEEKVPQHFYGKLNVYYPLPQGVTLDDVEVTMDCPGGEDDGTGSGKNYDDGREGAWSRVFYDNREQTQTQPQPQPQPEPHTHSWAEDTGKYKPVTCTTDGTRTYSCQCGETKTEKVLATGHDWNVGTEIKPTCTEPGSQSKTCKNCGTGLLDSKPATGHSWSAWVYSTGQVHKRSCSSCGAEEEERHTVPSGTVKCTGCGDDIVN